MILSENRYPASDQVRGQAFSGSCSKPSASAGAGDDGHKRGEAVGQGGRPGLQDQRRFDLVQRAALHRGNAVKTRPLDHLLGPKFLAAPRADDDVGGAR